MLGKLIKYEFKATKRILLPLIGLFLAFSAITGLIMNIEGGSYLSVYTDSGRNVFLSVLRSLVMMTYGIMVAGSICIAFFISVIRFHQNMLGDEGYLTHTLPVTAGQNLFAKLLVSVCWTVISFFCLALSGIIVGLLSGFTSTVITLKDIFSSFAEYPLDGFMFIVNIGALILALIFGVYTCTHACMSVGYSFARHRIAASVLLAMGLYSVTLLCFAKLSNLPTPTVCNQELWSLPFTVFLILESAAMFFIARYFLSRKLNLR